jgi:hypothetical protein
VKYLPLFHHFKATCIYQFSEHIIFLVKIVANASLKHFLCGLKLKKKKTCGGSDLGILYQRKNNANNLTSLSPYATDLTSDR